MLTTYLLFNMLGGGAPVVTTPPVPMPASSRRQGTVTITPSRGHPVSVADAKQQLRIDADDTSADDHIARLCAAAHRAVENSLGYPILRQTRRTALFGFPAGCGLWLGGGDALTVSAVRYFDTSGVQVTLPPTAYYLDAISRPAALYPAGSWPATLTRPGSVEVDWVAGWAKASDVPEDLVHAMKLLISHWDQNREAVVIGSISSTVQLTVDALLEPWRIITVY